MFLHRTPRLGLGATLLALACGCSSWNLVESYDRWTLYERGDAPVDVASWERAFRPAVVAVEEVMGPLPQNVRVHAWHGAVEIDGPRRKILDGEGADGIKQVPGIGPARIQAWHARGGMPGSRGIFISEPDAGTAAHELVHAHLASESLRLPLWLEEGLATLVGDGALYEGRWVIDGLAAWPLRELRDEDLNRHELVRLLSLRPDQETSVRENVLVHFIGWAVAFDLYRETGTLDWRKWLTTFDATKPLIRAQLGLERTLALDTTMDWLQRLDHPDPGVRLATVRGIWKVRDELVFERLMAALETEQHPEVQASLTVNLLTSSSKVRIPPRSWRRLIAAVRPVLSQPRLSDPREAAALAALGSSLQRGSSRSAMGSALEDLARFWRE